MYTASRAKIALSNAWTITAVCPCTAVMMRTLQCIPRPQLLCFSMVVRHGSAYVEVIADQQSLVQFLHNSVQVVQRVNKLSSVLCMQLISNVRISGDSIQQHGCNDCNNTAFSRAL
jgi:hypothetical protein